LHHILSAKNLETFLPFSVVALFLLLPVDSSTAVDIMVGGRSSRLPDVAEAIGVASELEERFRLGGGNDGDAMIVGCGNEGESTMVGNCVKGGVDFPK